jgi:hypothetical protein
MKLNKLLEELLKLHDDGHGDTEICVEADHGQTAVYAGWVSLEDYSEDDETTIHPDDLEDYEDWVLTKIILISG